MNSTCQHSYRHLAPTLAVPEFQKWLALLALSTLLAASVVRVSQAQAMENGTTDENTPPAQSVQVSTVRHPISIPYKLAYEMIRDVNQATDGRISMSFRVVSAKTKESIPGLEIYLEGENTHEKLEILPSGFVVVPLNAKAYADKAELVANQKQDSIHVNVILKPVLNKDTLTYGDIVQTINAGKQAMRTIVPWYLRLFAPSLRGVGMCYQNSDHNVALEDGKGTLRVADKVNTDDLNRKVLCATFGADEEGLRPENRIVPEAGWEPMFLAKI